MRELLEVLRSWPDIDIEKLNGLPECDQAVRWGWVLHSGELTGSGWRHVHDLPDGLVVK